jgi:hypothetical protein
MVTTRCHAPWGVGAGGCAVPGVASTPWRVVKASQRLNRVGRNQP